MIYDTDKAVITSHIREGGLESFEIKFLVSNVNSRIHGTMYQ